MIEFTKTMTWKGKNPTVTTINKAYETGIKLSKKAMKAYESVLERADGIKKWFVSIKPDKCKKIVNIELLM